MGNLLNHGIGMGLPWDEHGLAWTFLYGVFLLVLLYNLRKGRIVAAGYAPGLIPTKHINSLASQGIFFFNCLASLACQFIKVFIKCLNIYSQRSNQLGEKGEKSPKRLNDLAIISSNFKICQKIDEVSFSVIHGSSSVI